MLNYTFLVILSGSFKVEIQVEDYPDERVKYSNISIFLSVRPTWEDKNHCTLFFSFFITHFRRMVNNQYKGKIQKAELRKKNSELDCAGLF